jgi:hypothetical protein
MPNIIDAFAWMHMHEYLHECTLLLKCIPSAFPDLDAEEAPPEGWGGQVRIVFTLEKEMVNNRKCLILYLAWFT